MEDNIKVTGLVLNAKDYKDNDKIVVLFTLQRGKLSAIFRGVKKPKAKMKMAAQPFCFGEFILSERGNNYITTNCTLTESFYDLAYQTERFFAGCVVLEVIDYATIEGQPNEKLFLQSLKALKELTYETTNENVITAKFIIDTLALIGYKMNFTKCSSCRASVSRPYFSALRGGLLCPLCKDIDGSPIQLSLINNLKFIDNSDYERLSTIKIDSTASKKLLCFIANVFCELVGCSLKSLNNVL
ncbi:MAG TPA: DNA repair protein RecO [Clostridiales bacterium]|jgi:DNA repair protein RecO (recombination protein O)|nr:DNA repair protein RecO [Clostridiales bacterium]